MKKPETFFSVHLTPNETEAYEAGLKEGARRERRALERWLPRHQGSLIYVEKIENWLVARAKRKAR